MADDGGVQAMVDSAKKTLQGAHKFQQSAGGPLYSNASYSAARAARKTPKPAAASAPSTGTELEEKAKNVNNYVKGVSQQ